MRLEPLRSQASRQSSLSILGSSASSVTSRGQSVRDSPLPDIPGGYETPVHAYERIPYDQHTPGKLLLCALCKNMAARIAQSVKARGTKVRLGYYVDDITHSKIST